MGINWKKGRSKLGIFQPIIGSWITNAGSNDPTKPPCNRVLKFDLGNKYIIQDVVWHLGDKNYMDHTVIGLSSDKRITCWSFTSDGKNSTGKLADVSDIHPLAIGFESQMPAGLARQAFYPDEKEGFHWVVEAMNKKGWKRFLEQHYVENAI